MLFKAKHYLNKWSLLVLYYSFIHTYINYGNIAWGCTNRTNLKKTNSLQKQAIRILNCKDRFAHARELFRESKTLNVFQLNILNNLFFMHKVKSQIAPKIFQSKFCKPAHKDPTNFSTSNYSIPPFKLSNPKYRISIRGPTLWKKIPTNSEKMLESVTVFKNYFGSSPKVSFEKVVFKLLVFSWEICGGVSFLLIAMQMVSSLSVFALHCKFFLFLCLLYFLGGFFWKHLWETVSRTTS